ncbi:MAG: glycosyltransferase family 4 protein [Paludibacteraceae bacterium]|nr:glycosyltransferase family 4 protein [Paludibacteraceae bacterium]
MVVLQYIASPFWGGGEQYVFDLAKTMRTQYNVRTVFVCQPDTPTKLIERWEQIGHVYTLHPKTKNGKFSYLEAYRLARIIEREQADILHMHEMKDFFLCAYAKCFCRRQIRLIATRHIIGPAKHKASWLWVYRQIDAMIFVSQCAADAFLSQVPVRQAFRSIHIVPNSIRIPDKKAETISLREQYNIDPSLPMVLYHGRICPEKGILQLLQAIEPVFKGTYTIILAGQTASESKNELERLMYHSRLKGYILYLGFRTDCKSLIEQCLVGVLPSLVPEAASLALLEHMAVGSAVIASDNGSQPEFVTNGKEAILLPPGKWALWSEMIERMINNEKEARQMGEAARKRFEHEFGYTAFTQKIYSVYTDTLPSSSSER